MLHQIDASVFSQSQMLRQTPNGMRSPRRPHPQSSPALYIFECQSNARKLSYLFHQSQITISYKRSLQESKTPCLISQPSSNYSFSKTANGMNTKLWQKSANSGETLSRRLRFFVKVATYHIRLPLQIIDGETMIWIDDLNPGSIKQHAFTKPLYWAKTVVTAPAI